MILKGISKFGVPLTDQAKSRSNFIFKSSNQLKVDVLHTFNTVCDTKTPWVSTFETTIPRLIQTMNYHHENSTIQIDRQIKETLQLLQQDSCKKLIALSQCNWSIQEALVKEVFPEAVNDIMNKTVVIPPPQPLLVKKRDIELKMKDIHKEIRFIFVGRQFFRKGGRELIHVLAKIRKHFNVKFTIVSSLTFGDYATQTTIKDKEDMLKIIEQNDDWITWIDALTNEEVLALCKKSHVGLLPTWADTYGYSVLEMQASGCPVLTTNIRALPEINNDTCGWICPIPRNKFGEALYSTESSRKILSETLEKELEKSIVEICSKPEHIIERARNALVKIKEEHDPLEYGRKLFDIYNGKG
ncbi:glycosyltransferase family 4 protein [Bacillus carboniphilus]|uniref:Glycosyltransferase family 4 protein n=1 Tax=Bacillus carboniphilus TaxID=86663 RepID=A0ABY9JSY6_9BACI|nr:glycosyltransferase family 4 protein [Bacillus carboniphilus]WLR41535.1 glycosyltransferase family 4 protein [Bacillus carboniphilus]